MSLLNPPNHAIDPIQTLGRVAALASFGLFVIIILGYVDSRNRVFEEMQSQDVLLTLGTEQQQQLEEFRNRSASLTKELEEAERRAITETELTAVQDEILALAKQHGCMPKKASPRSKQVRDLVSLRQPGTSEQPGLQGDPRYGLLEVQELGLALSIEGDLKHTLEFLQAIKKQPWYCSTSQMVIRRDPVKASNMALEMDLKFLSLQRKQQDPTVAPPKNLPST